jgi:E3 ubiquitin-protein ligase MARCH6
MWFMLFIIAYIGIFGYAPRFVGSTVYMRIFKSTNIAGSDVDVHPATSLFDFGLVQLVSELNIETKRLNRALQLNDITMMVLGYMAMALLVAFVQILVAIRMRLYGTDNTEVENQRQEAFRGLGIGRDANEQAPDADADNNFVGIQVNDDAIEIRMTLGQFLSLALDCAGAFVKVGVLLFLKMILLPLILGVWLDAATLSAFGRTSSDRIFHVGNDLFSCLMVHWVVGISFMLLVTVSVLQLREVVHPSLLARTIRPQEPQPDLLGNLLNEGLPTHVKRMILSFTVYAILLLVQIWLPSRILKSLGLDVYIPILRPMLWYIVTPQLQIPLELLVFHLTMLSILEKYKNNIGGTQHVWLVWICRSLGLSDFLLPREVDRFVLVGYKNLFVQIENHNIGSNDDPIQCRSHVSSAMNPDLRFHNQVDPFWYELATHECDQERLIQSKIAHVSPTSEPKYVSVNRKRNGMCTVFGAKDYIRLPQPQSEHEKDGLGNGIPSESKVANVLLPSKMGKYRLRRRRSLSDDGPVIEFFKECQGKLIPRPPEGWDDLGIGGAEVQGRWAWGKESKSLVELGVSERNDFFDKENSMFQLGFLLFRFLLLILLSWVAATILVVLAVSLPLVFGRFFFHALHIPLRFWHDPVAFAIGLIVLFHFLEGATSIRHTVLSPLSWIQELHLPPRRKAATVINATFLWFFAIPCLLGVLYHVMVVKTPEWFTGEDRDVSLTSFFDSWVTGSVLLNAWAFLCVKSVFTKQFWINIGNLIFVVEGEDGNRGRDNGDDNTNEKFCWQGAKKGRIARFFRMLSRALLRNEWDKVDHDVLLAECVYPIATQATLALFLPSMLFAVWLLCLGFLSHENVGMVLPRFGLIFEGVFRQHVFRALTAVTVTVQLFLLSSVQLREWFEVLHKAARDDRYLVGEMLLNYFEDEN